MWDEQNHKGTVLDWEAFEAEVAKIDRQTHELKRTCDLYVSEPLYRGQRDATWHLTTTLDRRKAGLTLDNLPGFRLEGDICVDTDKAGKPSVAENVVEKYVIPASERGKVLASLAQRNISGDTLLGDTADDLLEDLWNKLLIDPTVCLL
jgi:hypothetical protein